MAHQPAQSLLGMLRAARQTHLRFISGALSQAEAPIYVIGNPSADLDSMICALIYSYFANRTSRRHIPLFNLPKVLSGPELRRLRPEFVKALWISTNPPADSDPAWEDTPESAGPLLRDHFLTVADFAENLKQHGKDHRITADAVLVDWNALPIRSGEKGKGSLDGLPTVEFSVVGCIDHHVDEEFLASNLDPMVIDKSGSCSSLVTNTLHTTDLWQDGSEETQVAQLALAPLLIDTTNLTAKDKVTPHDERAKEFLRRRLTQTDTDKYYEAILEAKQTSLDLLTVDEMLDRDYKQWAESPQQGKKAVNIGFCSMVKPIPWLVRKAGGAQDFLGALREFATQRELGIVVVMTAFGSPVLDGKFCRELLVVALEEGPAVDALQALVAQSGSSLDLQDWTALDGEGEEHHSQDIKSSLHNDQSPWRRIWVQGDVTKSRKQVAPLVRDAVSSQ